MKCNCAAHKQYKPVTDLHFLQIKNASQICQRLSYLARALCNCIITCVQKSSNLYDSYHKFGLHCVHWKWFHMCWNCNGPSILYDVRHIWLSSVFVLFDLFILTWKAKKNVSVMFGMKCISLFSFLIHWLYYYCYFLIQKMKKDEIFCCLFYIFLNFIKSCSCF